MDDLKLFSMSEVQIETLVETVQIVSTDMGMEFALKKCGVLAIKRGRMLRCDGIVLSNGDVMKELDKKG